MYEGYLLKLLFLKILKFETAFKIALRKRFVF